jgi:nucleoside-diphosphate-sugar epimerase
MVGRKFGSVGQEHLTWAVNVIAACNAARRFAECADSRIVAFSTGCVYPLMHVSTGGATEQTPPDPIGEYAMSCLGRERMFDYFSQAAGLKVLHFRLNYAVELRYGVLYDLASKVAGGQPVDVTTDFVNVIWQGDVCNRALLCLELAESPARALNITGPEMLSVRQVAEKIGRLLDKPVTFTGRESGIGYLSNASQANAMFGDPSVGSDKVIDWVAHWFGIGGVGLGKPTHFETQDGKY